MRAPPPPGFWNGKSPGKSGGCPRSAPIRGTPSAPPFRRRWSKEMLEAAYMAGYHKKPGPKARLSLTGRFHEGPKTQSAGHNARLFFYPFSNELQQDFVAIAKKNTAFSVSVHMLPTVLSTFRTPTRTPPNPCPPLQAPLSHGFGAAPGILDRIARRSTIS